MKKPSSPVLSAEFDTLFATRTGYTQLDRRIAKTQAKKAALLLVLEHPELPLHNNAAELAVRQRVRKRDVSFGPRSEAGKEAWDTFMTLAETTKKLGVSFIDKILGLRLQTVFDRRICKITGRITPVNRIIQGIHIGTVQIE